MHLRVYAPVCSQTTECLEFKSSSLCFLTLAAGIRLIQQEGIALDPLVVAHLGSIRLQRF